MDGPNHHDPTTGRWTAPDPMGDAGGDPDWYGYCLGDPVNMVAPLGLAYRGNDFGPGYDGMSGSAYGPPISDGWGYNDSPSDEGNGGDKDDNFMHPGGGRSGGGGTTGTWGTPAVQPDTAPSLNGKEDQQEEKEWQIDMGFFNEAAKMNQARRANEDEEKAKRYKNSVLIQAGRGNNKGAGHSPTITRHIFNRRGLQVTHSKYSNNDNTPKANPLKLYLPVYALFLLAAAVITGLVYYFKRDIEVSIHVGIILVSFIALELVREIITVYQTNRRHKQNK